jgi:hypothetical protein
MNEGQQHVHYSAVRDGDSYPIVDHDGKQPSVTLNMAYDGESGTEMAYQDAHPGKPLYAAKRWDMQRPTVGNTTTNRVRRMNLYFEDRIEYYITKGMTAGSSESGWRRLDETDSDYKPDDMQEAVLTDPYGRQYTATVRWLTSDGAPTGAPVGNPVRHMRHDARGNAYGRSRLADVVPGLNDAINRAGVSLQAAALLSGFKEVIITGFYPDVDRETGVNTAIRRSPSAMHYIEEKDVGVNTTPETDLNQLISVLDKWIVIAATLTSTPLSLFNLTAHTPAEGTQKQLESALVQSVKRLQRGFGQVWQDVVRMMLKFDALYSPDESAVVPIEAFDQIDDWDINIEWEPAETRNNLEEREIAATDIAQLGMPKEFVWERFFGAEEIARMNDMLSTRTNKAIGALAESIAEAERAAQQAAAQTTVTGTGPAVATLPIAATTTTDEAVPNAA